MIDEKQALTEVQAALDAAQKRIAELEARIAAEAKDREEHPHWVLTLLDSAEIGLWEWGVL